MYCINVSCHEKELIGTSADIELQITFNSPVPPVTDAEIDLYTVTYYDTTLKFKYDGEKHVCVNNILQRNFIFKWFRR